MCDDKSNDPQIQIFVKDNNNNKHNEVSDETPKNNLIIEKNQNYTDEEVINNKAEINYPQIIVNSDFSDNVINEDKEYCDTPKNNNKDMLQDNGNYFNDILIHNSEIQAQSDFREMLAEMKSALQIDPRDYSDCENNSISAYCDSITSSSSTSQYNSSIKKKKKSKKLRKRQITNNSKISVFDIGNGNGKKEAAYEEDKKDIIYKNKENVLKPIKNSATKKDHTDNNNKNSSRNHQQSQINNINKNVNTNHCGNNNEHTKSFNNYNDIIADLLGFDDQSLKQFLKESRIICEDRLNDEKWLTQDIEQCKLDENDKENLDLELNLIGISCLG